MIGGYSILVNKNPVKKELSPLSIEIGKYIFKQIIINNKNEVRYGELVKKFSAGKKYVRIKSSLKELWDVGAIYFDSWGESIKGLIKRLDKFSDIKIDFSGKYIYCHRCWGLTERLSNNQKYCPNCKKEVVRIQTKKRVKNHRKKVSNNSL